MTTEEFSNGFDTLVSSYRRFKDFDKQEMLDSIEFDEYEKSLFLTDAQEEVVVGLYTGRGFVGHSFEETEEMRRYLDVLVLTSTIPSSLFQPSNILLTAKSVLVPLPSGLAFIIYEQATFSDSSLGCADGSVVSVKPVTHDEFEKLKNNPFSGPTKRRVLRLDARDGFVELVSKYTIGSYQLRYLSKPLPIILEDMPDGVTVGGRSAKTECALNSLLHSLILETAVRKALVSKIGNTTNK